MPKLITMQGVFTRIGGDKILLRAGVLHDFAEDEAEALLAMDPPGARRPVDESAQTLAADDETILPAARRKIGKRGRAQTDEV